MNAPDDLIARAMTTAEQIADLAQRKNIDVATAESLTGGKIASHLSAAPSSSDWFRGGVVAYAEQVKYDVLGVPVGPVVSEQAARAMATGVARLMGASAAVAVTGVGGPGEEEGEPPGTVWFGVLGSGGETVHTELRRYDGDPEQVLANTTQHALELLLQHMNGR
ncbi:MAG TPA: CinA family protein [Actinomycetales bacterium]|jgi:nicotinamide-nucleotide amidase|nr:CinA family protein [Actinomycetales bacterium]